MVRQTTLRFRTWGGARKGAGRKPRGATAGVSHLARERFARRLPVHVTIRMASHVVNLRSRRRFSAFVRVLAMAAERFGVTIVQFSLQGNHAHFVVEAPGDAALSRAMQGFGVRVARALNRVMKRRGRVLADRYHAHVLRTPHEVRRAVAYARDNARKHASHAWSNAVAVRRGSVAAVDPFSSTGGDVVLPPPRTWLMRVGWRRARRARM